MTKRLATNEQVEPVMRALARAVDGLELPAVEKIAESQQQDPFQVLIATLLSARTQDATTLAASTRLFKVARTPHTLAELRVKRIERLIYPVSFYRHKARHVKATCQRLVDVYGGRVPTTMEELLTLPGVGRKTANLVLILAFKSQQNICVDTHVHRIANRLGWVRTRTPDETEQALYKATGAQWWPVINLYMVTWGQNVCRPIYPRCSECVLTGMCRRVGVTKISRRGSATAVRATA
jgi:endonuclease-3